MVSESEFEPETDSDNLSQSTPSEEEDRDDEENTASDTLKACGSTAESNALDFWEAAHRYIVSG
jgi:hypothetical protein